MVNSLVGRGRETSQGHADPLADARPTEWSAFVNYGTIIICRMDCHTSFWCCKMANFEIANI